MTNEREKEFEEKFGDTFIPDLYVHRGDIKAWIDINFLDKQELKKKIEAKWVKYECQSEQFCEHSEMYGYNQALYDILSIIKENKV